MCGSQTGSHKVLGKRLNQSQGRNPRKKIGISTTVCQCSDCKLIYSNPMPVPFSIEDHYGLPPEEYWIPEHFKIAESYFKNEFKTLKTLIDFKPGMKSLDIGAGIGKAMIVLGREGFDAYGVEPSTPFYEKALNHMKISPDKLKHEQIEDVTYPDNTFDFITFGAVLEHLYDPSASILKAMKWLKPNGIVHIEVPSSDWISSKIYNLFYRLIGTDYVTNISPMHSPYHLYEFGLKSFKEHARQHNYDVAYFEYYNSQMYLPKILEFFLRPYMRLTNKGMLICVWLRKRV